MAKGILYFRESMTNENKRKVGSGNLIKFSDKELSFKVFTSIDDCTQYWPSISCEDPFFSPQYFRILERKKLEGAIPLYAFVFFSGQNMPIASYYLQKKKLRLSDSIDTHKFVEGSGFAAKFKYWMQRIFFPMVYFNMMVVGNLLLTGNYGFRGIGGSVSLNDFKILKRLLKGLKSKLARTEYKFKGALIKDFFEKERCSDTALIGIGEFKVDPSMIVHIRSNWKNMDDYLLDMKSKHRVRIKKHLKRAADLEVRPLSVEEVVARDAEIFNLYRSVVNASGFNMVSVSQGYFADMVNAFPEQFIVKGMFVKNELVGFYTYMLKEGAVMSHFIGYSEKENRDHSIYFNILLGLIKDAIEHKTNKLYYYRTALEIKSSVGAEPYGMSLYLMHHNSLFNNLINIIIKTFFPNPVWTQRRPFKVYPESA